MKINLKEITVRELSTNFEDNNEDGVVGRRRRMGSVG